MNPIQITIESGLSVTDWLVAIAACTTALIAVFALLYAREQVRFARATREDVTRPYVVAYLKPTSISQQFVNLEFQNYGQTAAYNIEIKADPPLMKSLGGESPIRIFDKLSILAPGEKWTTMGDSLITRNGSGLPAFNRVVITYWSEHPCKKLTTNCTIDWLSMENRSFLEEKGIHQLVVTHEKLVAKISSLAQRPSP